MDFSAEEHTPPFHTLKIPLLDLRGFCQDELLLAAEFSGHFPDARFTNIVIPVLDKTIFNTSAGSRRQTYRRRSQYRPKRESEMNYFSPCRPQKINKKKSNLSPARKKPRLLLNSKNVQRALRAFPKKDKKPSGVNGGRAKKSGSLRKGNANAKNNRMKRKLSKSLIDVKRRRLNGVSIRSTVHRKQFLISSGKKSAKRAKRHPNKPTKPKKKMRRRSKLKNKPADDGFPSIESKDMVALIPFTAETLNRREDSSASIITSNDENFQQGMRESCAMALEMVDKEECLIKEVLKVEEACMSRHMHKKIMAPLKSCECGDGGFEVYADPHDSRSNMHKRYSISLELQHKVRNLKEIFLQKRPHNR